jgi:hypothetical protein
MVIVSAFFISDARLYKTYVVFVIFHIFLSFGVFWDMNLFWQQRSGSADIEKEIAGYIVKTYPYGDYIVVDELAPYGLQSVDMRLKSHASISPEAAKILIIGNFFIKDILLNDFKATQKRVFCPLPKENKMPIVLYEIDSPGRAMKLYFLDMKKKLRDINFLMWDYDYKSAAVLCDQYETLSGKGVQGRFENTMLRLHKMESCSVLDDAAGLYGVFTRDTDRIFMTADFFYYKGKTALRYGDKKTAYDSFLRSEKMAPWFGWPQKYIKELASKGTK